MMMKIEKKIGKKELHSQPPKQKKNIVYTIRMTKVAKLWNIESVWYG